MEITGKIIAVLTAKSGVSKSTGNPWMVQEFVLETPGQYPRKCVFNVFGEEKLKEFNIQIGQTITAYIDIDAREWEGKWFNTIKAYKIQHETEGNTPSAEGNTSASEGNAPANEGNAPADTSPSEIPAETSADLPF